MLRFKVMQPAMKAMKGRVAMKSGVLTQTQVVASVAETNGLKNKQVKGVIEALFAIACGESKALTVLGLSTQPLVPALCSAGLVFVLSHLLLGPKKA